MFVCVRRREGEGEVSLLHCLSVLPTGIVKFNNEIEKKPKHTHKIFFPILYNTFPTIIINCH